MKGLLDKTDAKNQEVSKYAPHLMFGIHRIAMHQITMIVIKTSTDSNKGLLIAYYTLHLLNEWSARVWMLRQSYRIYSVLVRWLRTHHILISFKLWDQSDDDLLESPNLIATKIYSLLKLINNLKIELIMAPSLWRWHEITMSKFLYKLDYLKLVMRKYLWRKNSLLL